MSASEQPKTPRRKFTLRYSKWVDAPLQNFIRIELEQRQWKISDLGRETGQDPSIISRWMQGLRPSPASLNKIADALGVSSDTLLELAGYREPEPFEDDPRKAALIAKLRAIKLTPDRYAFLDGALEAMRRRSLGDD